MTPGQKEAIAVANRISNPGCYATGMIAMIRPLVAAGLITADHPDRAGDKRLYRRRQGLIGYMEKAQGSTAFRLCAWS